MRRLFWSRPSPAMIVALLALVIALAGTSFAALKLSKNAVKTKNIKNGAVTNSKLANNAVTADKLETSAKSRWVDTAALSYAVVNQSGGVTVTPEGTGKAVVNFGVNISSRGIAVTPIVTLAATVAQYYRCSAVALCDGVGNNPNSIEVFTSGSSSGSLATAGFAAVATP